MVRRARSAYAVVGLIISTFAYLILTRQPSTLLTTSLPAELEAAFTSLKKKDVLNRLASNVNMEDPRRAEFDIVVALTSLSPKLEGIPRMKTPSPEYFREHIAGQGIPVIFTDMLEGSALAQWTWTSLRNKFGDVVFENTRQGEYLESASKGGKQEINRVSVKLSDFIDIVIGAREPVEEERELYITKQHFPREILMNDFVWPPFYPSKGLKCYLEPTGWIGAKDTFTQGHFDSKDNFAYQLIGRKRWTIYSPVDYDNLYFVPAKGGLEWSRALNTRDKPSLFKFPLTVNTNPLEFVLEEGEVLYLPRGWIHVVENLTPSLMVNTWRHGPAAISARWIQEDQEELNKLCMSPPTPLSPPPS